MLKRDEQSNKKKCEVKREECGGAWQTSKKKREPKERGGKWNEAVHQVPW